ncbi:MAG: ribonuclease J [Clostridia bacterium]|nr:ribonuclease J [Clostridia bacterium]
MKVIFLGGVGEIGKNMTAIEYGDDIIVIDAGAIFPNDETPGFDLIVPDITYLLENRSKIRGLVLTHGHEDHIGGVPYLLNEIRVPVYGTELTLALIDYKLREHKINGIKMNTIAAGDTIQLGVFRIQTINVNHSIPGALALAIHTPHGVIFHSGDFKIDLTPVGGEPIDLRTIGETGDKGVALYLSESTNIERPGYTMSEKTVGATMDGIFADNLSKRIIIATFASNVYRIQQIIDLAAKYKRKVALSGRTMLNVVESAERIGEIKAPEDIFVDITKIKKMADSELVIISTGTQGEAMSALTRMANGENSSVAVGDNDTIIISASSIPGNEKMIDRVINNLYRRGADVIYESIEKIHVSGHACLEEHKIVHSLVKPRFFIPIHGEYRHLKKHAALAEEMGVKPGNIIIPELGDCILLTGRGIRRGEQVPAGSRLIDGEGIEDEKASVVLEDRRQMSDDGIIIVALSVSGGEVVGEPAINSRGFVYDFHRDYQKEMMDVIKKTISTYDLSRGSIDEFKKSIKRALYLYIQRKMKQSPMIVPIVVEI